MGGSCCLPPEGEGEGFAGAAVLAAAVAQRLGWGPDTFWAATPADLRLALGVEPVGEAADGAALGRLMETFPDG